MDSQKATIFSLAEDETNQEFDVKFHVHFLEVNEEIQQLYPLESGQGIQQIVNGQEEESSEKEKVGLEPFENEYFIQENMPLEVTNTEYVEDQDHVFVDIHERLTLDTTIIHDVAVPSYSLQRSQKNLQPCEDISNLNFQGSNVTDQDLSKQNCNLPEELEFSVHSYEDPFAAFLKSTSGPKYFNLIIVEIFYGICHSLVFLF